MKMVRYGYKRGKFGKNVHVAPGIQVRKNCQGNWILYVSVVGKRRNKTCGHGWMGLRKATQIAEKLKTRMERSRPLSYAEGAKNVPLFSDYGERWLNSNSGKWGDGTLERYRQILRDYISQYSCFNRPVGMIDAKTVKEHLRALERRLSHGSVETIFVVLNGIFKEAVEDGIIAKNPCAGLLNSVLPRKRLRKREQGDPMSYEERNRFLTASERICTRDQQLLVNAMLYGGLRLSEAIGMKAEHLEKWRENTYHVTEQFRKDGEFSPPKRGKRRTVEFPGFYIEELKRYIEDEVPERRGVIFGINHQRGKRPYRHGKVYRLIRRICQDAGIRMRHPHDLRHTYASMVLTAKGIHYVQAQLGHASVATTVDVYGHLIHTAHGDASLTSALLGPSQPHGSLNSPSH